MLKIHKYFYNLIDFYTNKFTKNHWYFCEFLNILGFPVYAKIYSQKSDDFTQKFSQKSWKFTNYFYKIYFFTQTFSQKLLIFSQTVQIFTHFFSQTSKRVWGTTCRPLCTDGGILTAKRAWIRPFLRLWEWIG